jgi:hypothetical protein
MLLWSKRLSPFVLCASVGCASWQGEVRTAAPNTLSDEQRERVEGIMRKLCSRLDDDQLARLGPVDVEVVNAADLHFETVGRTIRVSQVLIDEQSSAGRFQAPLAAGDDIPSDDKDSILAFAFAHELAHRILPAASSARPISEREHSADAFALGLVRSAGYKFSPALLERMTQHAGGYSSVLPEALEPNAILLNAESCAGHFEMLLRAASLREIDRLSRPDLVSEYSREAAARDVNQIRESRRYYLELLARCEARLTSSGLLSTPDFAERAERARTRIADIRSRVGMSDQREVTAGTLPVSDEGAWRNRSLFRLTARAGLISTSVQATKDQHSATESPGSLFGGALIWEPTLGGLGVELDYGQFRVRLPPSVAGQAAEAPTVEAMARSYRVTLHAYLRALHGKHAALTLSTGLGYARDEYALLAEGNPKLGADCLVLSPRGEFLFRPVSWLNLGVALQLGNFVTFGALSRGEVALSASATLVP